MTTPITNIETNSDLTAESGSLAGRTTTPPETAAARITDRQAVSYPVIPAPPTPIWYTNSSGTAIPGGTVTPTSIQLFWKSNVGAIAAGSKMPPLPPTASADPINKGSAGVQHLGVGGHNIYINGATSPSLRLRGPATTAIITGYFNSSGVWTLIQPNTTYTIVVEACYPTGTLPGLQGNGPTTPSALAGTGSGNKSASLSVTTPLTTTTSQQVTTPPPTAGGVQLTAPVPVITAPAGVQISMSWNRVSQATGYELWDNNSTTNDLQPDPNNPGFFLGDYKVGTITQVALPATTVTYMTPAYQIPGVPFRLKVRSVKTDSNGTAYSAFSPVLRGTIPPALTAPATPPAPTAANNASPAHSVNVTVNANSSFTGGNAPEYYKIYDGATLKTQLTAAQIGTPYQIQYAGSGVNYSITVVAGNSKGLSVASPAATGTTT